MGSITLRYGIELKTLQCGTCGVWHAIPKAMYDSCYKDGGYWKCPNGHSRGWEDGNFKSMLKMEKDLRMKAEAALYDANNIADYNERRRIAQKAATTRLKNKTKRASK